MNNLKKSVEKDYRDVTDLILLEKYDEAIVAMYNIIQKLVAIQMDDACLVSKGFESDLETLYGAGVLEKGPYEDYVCFCNLYELKEDGAKIDEDLVREAAERLRYHLDFVTRRELLPQQNDINSGSYEGNIDFPLVENPDENNDQAVPPQNNMHNVVNQYPRPNQYQNASQYPNANQYPNFNQYANPNPMFNNQNPNMGMNNSWNNNGNIDDVFSQNRRIPGNKKLNIQFSPKMIIRILIPVVCIIVIIAIFKTIFPSKKKETISPVQESTTSQEEYESYLREMQSSMEETTTTAASDAGTYVVTGDAVSLRYEPNTNARIHTRLNKNVEIQVLKFYDADWALVEYDGKKLYISRNFIAKQ